MGRRCRRDCRDLRPAPHPQLEGETRWDLVHVQQPDEDRADCETPRNSRDGTASPHLEASYHAISQTTEIVSVTSSELGGTIGVGAGVASAPAASAASYTGGR